MAETSASNAVVVGTDSGEMFPKPDELGGVLFPGIPNDVTIEHVCTKLTRKACYRLSSVSPKWRQAIQSGLVGYARIRSQSAETLLLHSHDSRDGREHLYLYSGVDKCFYELPRIEGFVRGNPWECQCVALDGRIYLLGGGQSASSWEVFKEVYMLDLVRMQWKPVASMQEGRHNFSCGVSDGKIYVFGGFCQCGPLCQYGPLDGSEVYDPKIDEWSRINTTTTFGLGHQVATLEEELLLCGRILVHVPVLEKSLGVPEGGYDFIQDASFLGIYHPVKHEWKLTSHNREYCSHILFVADGKLHLWTRLGIYVEDREKKSWKKLHSNSFPRSIRSDSKELMAAGVEVVGDQLFLGVYGYITDDRQKSDSGYGFFLLEGKGFGSDSLDIVWEEAACSEFWKLKCAVKL